MGGRGAKSETFTQRAIRLSKGNPDNPLTQRAKEYLERMNKYNERVSELKRDDNIKTVREETPDVRVRASNVKLDNKNSVIDFVKRQTGIDLSKVVEPRTSRSRTYLGVHLEDLTRNQQNEVRRVLNAYGRKTRIGDNGGYGYAIYYQK